MIVYLPATTMNPTPALLDCFLMAAFTTQTYQGATDYSPVTCRLRKPT